MTDNRGQWPPQDPQQGQQYPQGQPWQPQQYDPAAHQQRLGQPQQPWPPQGQPGPQSGQQPGYGQPPQSFPPQQGYAPQPPVPPGHGRRGRKSWPARHKVLTGLIAFAALVTIGGIAGAAGSAPKKTAAAAAGASASAPVSGLASASSSPHARAHARKHASAHAAAPAASARPSASPVPAVRTVATFAGSGIQNTPRFTVTSSWKLAYSFDCSSFGSSGNFQVFEDGGQDFSGVSVNALAKSGKASTWAYSDGGTHYLEVNSECSWTVKIIDEGSA